MTSLNKLLEWVDTFSDLVSRTYVCLNEYCTSIDTYLCTGFRQDCWSVLGPSSRASRSNLELTSLTIRFLPFTEHHGDSVAAITPSVLSLLPSSHASAVSNTLLQALFFLPSILALAFDMKFVFDIKTEPVTQASIIISVVAFSSGSLAMIAVYSDSPSVCVLCTIVLALIVYAALRFAPR